MIDPDLKTIAHGLSATLAERVDVSDGEFAAPLLHGHFQSQVLGAYAEQLDGLDASASWAWLLRRMAAMEAQLLLLQMGQAGMSAVAPAPPPAAAAMAGSLASAAPELVTLPIICDDALVQVGFHRTEQLEDGTKYRWVGPAPFASVFFPKLAAITKVTLHVISAFVPQVLDQIRVAVDGGEWVSVTVEPWEYGLLLHAEPQPGDVTNTANMRLDIDAVQTDTPLSRGGSDARELAIAVSKVEITGLAKGLS